MKRRAVTPWVSHAVLVIGSLIMIYPLLWMLFATFKQNAEIFGSSSILPEKFPFADPFAAYKAGWNGLTEIGFSDFYWNTIVMTVPTVLFTVISCSLVAYGFARFNFPSKKLWFAVMLSTLMLPNAVIVIPRYLLFNSLGWLNTYLPFIVPALFACFPFFIFMLVQFIRGIPRELDESAKMDGCSAGGILFKVLLPVMKPALFSAGLFQFMWTWNEFFDVLIYVNSVEKYPLALGLRISMDTASDVQWNVVMAMGLLSVLPLVLIFFFAQRYFVEGIATTGLKG
ncbi:carbohydrate ABC transporter permease [Paenibacillus thalictri]|uniref:Carbohydrate ABC transporter permease n=2 Tax=Paenibacillus thalictri TaxID=2527873 RepID=A0A4Q9DMZ4_9BACL|nr:carbohydrate ABC transporter permease [Paenibacillus thalictri]TBL75187.1 carbohydrate ABC transporter permease [Paenibacillus thalictri]